MAEHDNPTPARLVPMAIVFEGGLAVVAWLAGWLFRFHRPPLAQIRWNPADAAWGVAATVPLLTLLWLTTRYPVGPLKGLKEVVERTITPLFRELSLADFALISLLAGVGEELLFRGVVQEGLFELSGSTWLALALASLVFGLAHPITTTYAVLAMLIGAYLGWLWLATDNLLTPIVTHALYDFGALVYLVRREK